MKKLTATYEGERQGHLVFKASNVAEEDVYSLLTRPGQPIKCDLDGKPFVGKLITGWPFPDGTARFVVKPQKVAHKALFVSKALPPSLAIALDERGTMAVHFEQPDPKAIPFDEAFKRVMRGQPLQKPVQKATATPSLRRYQSGQWG